MTSANSHGAELDGKGVIAPTPFDAHDKVVRDSGDYAHQEYPKAIDHMQKPGAPEGHFEPVVANDAAHEAELVGASNPDPEPELTQGKE